MQIFSVVPPVLQLYCISFRGQPAVTSVACSVALLSGHRGASGPSTSVGAGGRMVTSTESVQLQSAAKEISSSAKSLPLVARFWLLMQMVAVVALPEFHNA